MEFLLVWLPWWIIAACMAGLVYAGLNGLASRSTITIGAIVLFIATIILGLIWTDFYEWMTGDELEVFFPELIDTRPWRRGVDDALTWVVRNWGGTLEALASPLLWLLIYIEKVLLAVPWWLLTGFLTFLAWLATRGYGLPAIVFVSMIFLGIMDLWEDSVETMALMITATLTAIVISLPVGIAMSRAKTLRNIVTPVLDLMQTMPSFVYLIPTVMIFGPGRVPALLATIIYAAPPLIRLTDLGIRMVDPQVMEATRAFGTDPRQRLFGVQIPLSMPTILAGINQTTMMALAMVVIASMIGAGGLGYQVLQGIGRLEVSRGLFAGLGIVALAIIFDRVTQAFGRQLQQQIGLAERQA